MGTATAVLLSGLETNFTYYFQVIGYYVATPTIVSGPSNQISYTGQPTDTTIDNYKIPDSFFVGSNLSRSISVWDASPTPKITDYDGDNVANWREYVEGTDMLSPGPATLLNIERRPGKTIVYFNTIMATGPGYENLVRTYTLQSCTDLNTGDWQNVPGVTDIIGEGFPVVYTIDSKRQRAEPQQFFRLGINLKSATALKEEKELEKGFKKIRKIRLTPKRVFLSPFRWIHFRHHYREE
ncbi:MAG: hypothetical protein WCG27_11425 [Pseudomonadota bacterium]